MAELPKRYMQGGRKKKMIESQSTAFLYLSFIFLKLFIYFVAACCTIGAVLMLIEFIYHKAVNK